MIFFLAGCVLGVVLGGAVILIIGSVVEGWSADPDYYDPPRERMPPLQ